MSLRSRLLFVLATSHLACSTSLKLPDGAQVRCDSNDECPSGLVCVASLGRCLAPSGDATPPAIVEDSISLEPALSAFSAGRQVRVRFTVTKDLASDPEVRLGAPEAPLFVKASESARTYEYTYVVAESFALTPGAWPVLASLIDTQGLQAQNQALATLVLDFTAPSIAAASVGLEPSLENPLTRVQALTDGTMLRVTFNTSEPLVFPEGPTGGPEVRAICGASTFALTRQLGETSTTLFTYMRVLTEDVVAPDGQCSLEADLEDVAGNLAPATSLGVAFLLDRTPPDATTAVDMTKLLHLRAPWGADLTGGAARHYLVRKVANVSDWSTPIAAEAFFQPGEELVEVRVYDDEVADANIGRLVPFGLDWMPAALSSRDARALWVSVIDAAGNESERVRIKYGEWLATLSDKVAGSFIENPHVLEMHPALGRVRGADITPRSPQFPVGYEEGGEGGAGMPSYTSGSWHKRTLGSDLPPAVEGGRLVYDSRRGRVVQFGGRQIIDEFYSRLGSDMFELASDGWHRVPAAGPLARRDHGMVFDSRRGRVLVMGGDPGEQDCGGDVGECVDTWAWDGTRWKQLATNAYDGRSRFGVAYDAGRDRVVMFGGIGVTTACSGGVSTLCNDTWAFNGESWSKVSSSGPSARANAAMAYDAGRDRVVLFGGQTTSGVCTGASAYCTDTWEWSGSQWTLVDSDGPIDLVEPRLAYDEQRERLVLVGGSADETIGGMTYEWDGESWTFVAGGGDVSDPSVCTDPEPAYCAGRGVDVAYDPLRRSTVMFGGCFGDCSSVDLYAPDTWFWDGEQWQYESSAEPPARRDPGMVYDPYYDQTVLFGGASLIGTPSSETWIWNGRRWRFYASGSPGARYDHAMAYSPWYAEVVVFGGFRMTSAYASCGDGTNATGQGWCNLRDTWVLYAGNWYDVTSAGPAGRRMAAMAYDPTSNDVLMYGGTTTYADGFAETWRWTPNYWSTLNNGDPGPRHSHAMAADLARKRVVLFGGVVTDGSCGDLVCGDTWEWDGADWTQVSVEGPAARTDAVMTYDVGRERILLTGGRVETGLCPGATTQECDDLWEFDGELWTPIVPANVDGIGIPAGRSHAAAVYDTHRRETVIFGGVGSDGTALAKGTYTFDGGLDTVQGHVSRHSIGAAQLFDGTTISKLGVRWRGAAEASAHDWIELVGRYSRYGSVLDETFAPQTTRALTWFDGVDIASLWRVRIREYDGYGGTLTGWCIDANGEFGGPYCKASSSPLVASGVLTDEIDLRDLTSVPVSGLSVSLQVSHDYDVSSLTAELEASAVANTPTLYVFDRGGWRLVDAGSEGLGIESVLEWSTTEANQIARMPFGTRGIVSSAVTPGAQTEAALFGTEYSELRISYTLP